MPQDQEKQLPIQAIKGFNADMTCRGFQFEPNGTYTHDGDPVACKSGFHAISGYPLEVLKYYPPAGSRYFHVKQSGQVVGHSEDSKTASTILKVGAEISLAGLIKLAVEYTTSRCKPVDPKSPAFSDTENGCATASGSRGAATASGDSGAATASGYSGAATASGRHSTASAPGFYGKAKGIDGTALFLVRRDDESEGDDYGRILFARAFVVGQDGIKADTLYMLNNLGEPVEV